MILTLPCLYKRFPQFLQLFLVNLLICMNFRLFFTLRLRSLLRVGDVPLRGRWNSVSRQPHLPEAPFLHTLVPSSCSLFHSLLRASSNVYNTRKQNRWDGGKWIISLCTSEFKLILWTRYDIKSFPGGRQITNVMMEMRNFQMPLVTSKHEKGFNSCSRFSASLRLCLLVTAWKSPRFLHSNGCYWFPQDAPFLLEA